LLRVAARKVDSLANCRSLQGHQAAACIVFPAHLAASDALAAPDVVPRQNAVHFPASFLALGRDSPSASVETARQDVHRTHQVLQPLVAQKKVESQTDLRAAFQQALLAAAHWAQPSAVRSVTADESVSAPQASLLARRGQRVLQPAEQWSAQPELEQALLEQQALWLAHSILVPQEPEPQEL
jgi:hypothetical protein